VCGRYTLTSSGEELARHFEAQQSLDLRPRFNISPTQKVLAVRAGEGEEGPAPQLTEFQWGLVPSWARDVSIGQRTFNARSESVADKPSFRESFRARRCLIPLTGFYEWPRGRSRRGPRWFHPAPTDGEIWAAAGLWDRWVRPEGGALETCTILTTRANEVVAETHDRMPVLLERSDYSRWLDPGTSAPGALRGLLKPWPARRTAARAVSDQVNDSRAEGPALLMPAGPPPQGELFD
jgi:putative SOS response-associated peptidase YedK